MAKLRLVTLNILLSSCLSQRLPVALRKTFFVNQKTGMASGGWVGRAFHWLSDSVRVFNLFLIDMFWWFEGTLEGMSPSTSLHMVSCFLDSWRFSLSTFAFYLPFLLIGWPQFWLWTEKFVQCCKGHKSFPVLFTTWLGIIFYFVLDHWFTMGRFPLWNVQLGGIFCWGGEQYKYRVVFPT